jgi:hypothetical protein
VRRIVPALVLLLATAAVAADVTVVDWNLLNFPGSTGATRAPYMRTVLAYAAPDLMVCEEVAATAGRDYFQNNVLNVLEPGAWASGGFHDGYDTDRALFYRIGVLEVVGYGWLTTELRDIDWWQVREVESGAEFRVFAAHLKASQGYETDRLAEVTILRNFLLTLPADLPVIFTGDLNLYTATEPAYQLLLSAGPAQLHDPLDRPGNWHDNAAFADIHTQSTRTESFGGGATGGMDDRFDFMLVNDDFLDAVGPEIQPATYAAIGNDGNHLNVSIIFGGNTAVPTEVATALYQSSDHLPLSCRFSFPAGPTGVGDVPVSVASLRAWPNPFNPVVSLRVEGLPGAQADLVVYDVAGRQVAQLWRGVVPIGGQTLTWQPADLPSGVYFARLGSGAQTLASTRLVLLK